jgi:hypothetical protein
VSSGATSVHVNRMRDRASQGEPDASHGDRMRKTPSEPGREYREAAPAGRGPARHERPVPWLEIQESGAGSLTGRRGRRTSSRTPSNCPTKCNGTTSAIAKPRRPSRATVEWMSPSASRAHAVCHDGACGEHYDQGGHVTFAGQWFVAVGPPRGIPNARFRCRV